MLPTVLELCTPQFCVGYFLFSCFVNQLIWNLPFYSLTRLQTLLLKFNPFSGWYPLPRYTALRIQILPSRNAASQLPLFLLLTLEPSLFCPLTRPGALILFLNVDTSQWSYLGRTHSFALTWPQQDVTFPPWHLWWGQLAYLQLPALTCMFPQRLNFNLSRLNSPSLPVTFLIIMSSHYHHLWLRLPLFSASSYLPVPIRALCTPLSSLFAAHSHLPLPRGRLISSRLDFPSAALLPVCTSLGAPGYRTRHCKSSPWGLTLLHLSSSLKLLYYFSIVQNWVSWCLNNSILDVV